MKVEIADIDCPIISADINEVKCRTPLRSDLSTGSDLVYLYLKAAETATFSVSNSYTWVDTGSLVSMVTLNFDSLSNMF